MFGDLTDRIDAAPEGPRVAALFDLDRTLLEGFSAYAFLQERLVSGHMSPRELQENLATIANMRMGRLNMSGAMRASLHALRGVEEASFEGLGDRVFRKHLRQRIYPEARRLIGAHRRRGHTVAIISSATRYQIEPVARELGIDEVLCTELEVDNGRLTGEALFECWREGKAEAARRLAKRLRLRLKDSFFYTDAVEDLPLLELVGHPHPLNPDQALAAIAAERGWPVHYFAKRRTGWQEVLRTGLAYGGMVPAMMAGWSARVLTGSPRQGANVTMSTWADLATAAIGLDIRVSGREHLWSQRPAVFVFNHQSAADAPIMSYLLREDCTGIAKVEASRNPFTGPFLKSAGVVFVDRADRGRAIEAMQPAVDAVRRGISIAIAPEGTRSDSERMGPFKKGPFHLAIEAQVPMVPVVIHNARDAQPKGESVFRPATVYVEVLPPVDTSAWRRETIDEHVADVRGRMLVALGQEEAAPPRGSGRRAATRPRSRQPGSGGATKRARSAQAAGSGAGARAKAKTTTNAKAKAKTKTKAGAGSKARTRSDGKPRTKSGARSRRSTQNTGTAAGSRS
jgi:putative phosphoserine phosphatase/1-acylglycerol-3-phosphate O-acyltransferase